MGKHTVDSLFGKEVFDKAIVGGVNGHARNGKAKNGAQGLEVTVDFVSAKKSKKPAHHEVHDIEVMTATVRIMGTSPLIQNRFHGAGDMEAERALDAETKRGLKKSPRPPVIPTERYGLARIVDEQGRDCIEAAKVKAALVTAATRYQEIGVPGTQMRGAVRILGDMLPIIHKGVFPKNGKLKDFRSGVNYTGEEDWAKVKSYVGDVPAMGLPRMRRDIARVGTFPNKKPDLRYRPEFRDWSVDLVIEYEPALISLAGLYLLLRRAGRSIGLYEWRPEKSPAGIYGCFDLAEVVKAQKARHS
jgi:hypothetical protein